ncbi:MAG: HTH-type transcriptional activator CmpR [Verrucomicrobiota bacterium]
MGEPLDSRQLRAFVVLARTLSFTRTAHELNLTQSAVSHSIKALERDVACRLFDRVGKTVLLTQAGEQLLAQAEKILSEMEVARAELGRLGRWGSSRMRIGAGSTACQYILPPVLREFRESFAHCDISIQPGDTPRNLERLQAHQIDLAINLEPKQQGALDIRPIFSDELAFVLSPLHPWAKAGKVTRDEIPRQNYIFYEKASYTFAMIEDYFREEGTTLFSTLEMGSVEAAKELVKLGYGVSILAPWTLRKELAEGSLVTLPLGRRKLRRKWAVLLSNGRRLSLAEETFIGLCQSVAEGLA